MAGGHVDRNVLASKFQNYGDTYDDTKTEAAMEVLAQQNDENWDAQVAHKTAAVLDHPDGSVKTQHIAPQSVTLDKLAPDIQTSGQPEVALARVSVPNKKTYTTLKDRLDSEFGSVLGMFDNVKDPKYGAKGDGVTDDTNAFKAAFAALDGTTKNALYVPPGVYLLSFNGDIKVPINVHIFASYARSKLLLGQSNTRLVWESPGTSATSYTQYWPYMNAGATNIDFNGAGATGARIQNSLIYISKVFGTTFNSCGFNNAKDLVTIQNKDGLWTEQTRFNGCGFGDADNHITFDGNTSGTSPGVADGSFAYTRFNDCTWSLGEKVTKEIGIKIINGGTLYGGNIEGNAWVRKQSGGVASELLNANNSTISYIRFNIKGESFGEATYLVNMTGGKFWYNAGSITLPSPRMLLAQDASADVKGNAVCVMGSPLQNAGGNQVFLGEQIPSYIVDHLVQRVPLKRTVVHMSKAGLQTRGGFVGLLPSKASRILRAEIGASTPGSANPGGKWYFDIAKGFDGVNRGIVMNLTSLFLPDGVYYTTVDVDISKPDTTWTIPMPVKNSDAAGQNTGTAPTDVSLVLEYI